MTEIPALRTALADAAQRHYGRRPRRSAPIRRATAALAVAGAVAVLVAAMTGAPDRERTASPADQRTGPPPASFPSVPNAAQRFSGVLRRADPVPAGDPAARAMRDAAMSLSYGQDADRFVIREATRAATTVMLGVGDRVTCLGERTRSGGGSLGCGPTHSAVDPDRPMISWSEGGRISGAMVDGVRDVVVHRADGSRVQVALEDNLFSLTVEGDLTRLTYRKPDGSTGSLDLKEPREAALRDADLTDAP